MTARDVLMKARFDLAVTDYQQGDKVERELLDRLGQDLYAQHHGVTLPLDSHEMVLWRLSPWCVR